MYNIMKPPQQAAGDFSIQNRHKIVYWETAAILNLLLFCRFCGHTFYP